MNNVFRVRFERRTTNADNGKIVVVVTNTPGFTGLEGSIDVNIWLRVTSPIGVIYDAITDDEADPTLVLEEDESGEVKIDIPTYSGADIDGIYLFEFKVENVGDQDPAITNLYSAEYEYCACNKAALSLTGNCGSHVIRLRDVSVYGEYGIISRVLTLEKPTISGVQEDPSTTGGQSLNYVSAWTNVTYIGTVDVDVSKVTEVVPDVSNIVDDVPGSFETAEQFEFSEYQTWSTTKSLLYSCGASLKPLAKCIEDKIKEIGGRACGVGSYRALSKSDIDTLEEIQSLTLLWMLAKECGDNDKMSAAYTSLKKLLNCGCCGADDAQPLEPADTGVQDPNTYWVDIAATELITGWSKATGVIGGQWLKYKVGAGMFHVSALLQNASISGTLPRKFLKGDAFAGVGITEFFSSAVFQEYQAGSDSVAVGHVYWRGGAFWFQPNTLFDPSFPIRISASIPLL